MLRGVEVRRMSMDKKRVVVVGGSFGGINAAYELRRRLPRDAEITVTEQWGMLFHRHVYSRPLDLCSS